MSIIADPPAGLESWPDIRSVMQAGGGLMTVDAVASTIAQWEEHQSGRRLIHRVENPGRGPSIYVHPTLVDTVRR
ncbi:hypothetical protein ACFXQA_10050 [Microbacterium sp. P07]|uniref:hypothetical protein n=1 Tax=Microbacterium sp. P07 TaxID=3366952 RepID=UPI0037472FD1